MPGELFLSTRPKPRLLRNRHPLGVGPSTILAHAIFGYLDAMSVTDTSGIKPPGRAEQPEAIPRLQT